MFFRKPTHKKFDYQPRFYNPNKDKEEKRKERLGFRTNYRNKSKTKKPIGLILMLVIILYFFLKYNGYL